MKRRRESTATTGDGRGGGRGGRGAGGRGGGGRGTGTSNASEKIDMTSAQQNMVGVISSLSLTGRGGGSGGSASAAIRTDVDQDDVDRKCFEELTRKKGFAESQAKKAMEKTTAQRAKDGDLAQGFNEQKKRRVHRAMDWLILNCSYEELPEAFKKSAKEARDSRKKKKGGEEEDDEDDEVGATASSSSRETDVTKELFFAGFGKKIAKMAILNARGEENKKGDVALDDLLSAMSESLKKTALKRAKMAFAESGLEDASKERIEEILLDARRKSWRILVD